MFPDCRYTQNSVDECIDLIVTGKHLFLGHAKLLSEMLPEDLNPWVDKLAILSLKGGESTTVHVLYVDRKGCDLIVDVLSSNRPYPDSEHRAFPIPFRRILSVCPAPAGLSPRRPLPSPDPCRAEYGSLDRILLFGPVVLFMVFGSLFLFIFLEDLPYGIQLASIISYTTAVFLITFSAQKRQQRYLFTCPVVHSQLSRLAQRHVGFLAILFVLQTAALSLRSRMPANWFVASGRNMPPFTLALFILCMGLGFTQVFTNRSLLERAHLEHPPA